MSRKLYTQDDILKNFSNFIGKIFIKYNFDLNTGIIVGADEIKFALDKYNRPVYKLKYYTGEFIDEYLIQQSINSVYEEIITYNNNGLFTLKEIIDNGLYLEAQDWIKIENDRKAVVKFVIKDNILYYQYERQQMLFLAQTLSSDVRFERIKKLIPVKIEYKFIHEDKVLKLTYLKDNESQSEKYKYLNTALGKYGMLESKNSYEFYLFLHTHVKSSIVIDVINKLNENL